MARQMGGLWIAWTALALTACTKSQESEPAGQEIAVQEASPALPASSPRPVASPKPGVEPREIDGDSPLSEGLVSFEGMIRGTKGGFDVRGVIFDFDELRGALPEGDRARRNDELLGARLRITAELRAHHAEPLKPGEPQLQMRSGDWFSAARILSVEVAEPAVMIEGVVGRSKGLFTVGKHMVSRDDLDWSLAGAEVVGKKVRLWGQPRTYVCPPQAQCLISGEIPMFDVARAELP
ncbi:MAG: hypothetical protein KC766_25875 [Myxococcales bacterium]|nr:hypothetical protein [Myxococcales bacterium]